MIFDVSNTSEPQARSVNCSVEQSPAATDLQARTSVVGAIAAANNAGRVRQRGGNSGVAEVAADHAATVEI